MDRIMATYNSIRFTCSIYCNIRRFSIKYNMIDKYRRRPRCSIVFMMLDDFSFHHIDHVLADVGGKVRDTLEIGCDF